MHAQTLAAVLQSEDEQVLVEVNGKLYEVRKVVVRYFDDEKGNSGIAVIIQTEG